MSRHNVSSGSPFEPEIGFSRAVRIGNTISVSGTAPIGPDGQTVYSGNLYLQTKHCIAVMLVAIGMAGGKLDDVIRTRIMLRDVSQWREAARAHREFFADVRPACTFIEVSAFIREDWLVELEADCVLEPRSG